MRRCAIDIGSNSVRCLIADVSDDGAVRPVDRGLVTTRLAEGLGETGVIGREAARRTISAVRQFLDRAASAGAEEAVVFCTQALREASNAPDVTAELERETGIKAQVLSGRREAELIGIGVTAALPTLGADVAIVDIGGGSTELVSLRRGLPPLLASIPLGCVRLTERFFASDPPTAKEKEEARRFAASLIALRVRLSGSDAERLVGAGGTITTAAAVSLGLPAYSPELIHGSELSIAEVRSLLDRLSALPLAERKAVPGLDPARADIIVAGLVILEEIMKEWGADRITVSDEGILRGVLLAPGLAGTPLKLRKGARVQRIKEGEQPSK